ncbi:MAG: EscU/YscU/HrcU family type III secretion system export apparatus switch protein [Gammaproteobacteria bacterium]
MKHGQPVNIAVALHWDGASAPRVTAKGCGELAQRIADKAREHDVPISDDPQLVEILAQVELGHVIPEALYVAVAEVIAFAYSVHGGLPERIAELVERD